MDIDSFLKIGNKNGLAAPWLKNARPIYTKEMKRKIYFTIYLNISSLAMIYLWYFSNVVFKEIYVTIVFLAAFLNGYFVLHYHSQK